MKEEYKKPLLEVTDFDAVNVLTTSTNPSDDEEDESKWTPWY